ncbi:hypothetical protein [Arthrobacter wenxiniae]|jgi:hypothetical protein|uniref:Uncharacterized protein n=1 Tax=Arthrobacter wenxiniae TaxID=2713570 RepID=A0A7Y7IEU3_9MICC|nr:hypothetical protein [Arthrobacter wenxiniae]NVM94174.1 hypothetical protein [Arthrobacter wenxiniae]
MKAKLAFVAGLGAGYVLGTLPDVESDPALNDVAGRDWADEGGALPSGPSQ